MENMATVVCQSTLKEQDNSTHLEKSYKDSEFSKLCRIKASRSKE